MWFEESGKALEPRLNVVAGGLDRTRCEFQSMFAFLGLLLLMPVLAMVDIYIYVLAGLAYGMCSDAGW